MTLHRKLARFMDKTIPEPMSGCWLWEGAYSKRTGYGNFRLSNLTEVPAMSARRAAWEIFNGSIPAGALVCHRCDTRLCVNPDHLFLGSHADNSRDAANKGRLSWTSPRRLPFGEKHHQAKVSEADVKAIRSSPEMGITLAARFGVSPTAIGNIRARKTWRHVA